MLTHLNIVELAMGGVQFMNDLSEGFPLSVWYDCVACSAVSFCVEEDECIVNYEISLIVHEYKPFHFRSVLNDFLLEVRNFMLF